MGKKKLEAFLTSKEVKEGSCGKQYLFPIGSWSENTQLWLC